MADLNALNAKVERLEERMNTERALTDSALDRLRADLAQRDKDNIRWQVGLQLALWASAIAIFGVIVTL